MTTDQISALLNADAAAVLEMDRQHYFKQVKQAAKIIAANADKRPVIMLAGPSGSGKTTSAILISRELEAMGMPTHMLPMDDYFSPLTREELALLKENKLDLEKPTRVDIPFFRMQLGQLLAGERVELPRYDFKESKRVFEGKFLQRKPGELIIMEGIHALNPDVTGYTDQTSRVYVSVRTRITSRDGSVLHPSFIRLARRLLRDRTGRNRALTETIAMRQRVDAGEQNYIMPFKGLAHCSIDSFYSCEMSIYRPFLLDELRQLLPKYPDLRELVHILEELPDLSTELVPRDSLLREFIGGSELHY